MVARGDQIAGWSHPLYPDGDIRAVNLLAALKPKPAIARALRALEQETGDKPNCDAARRDDAPTSGCRSHCGKLCRAARSRTCSYPTCSVGAADRHD